MKNKSYLALLNTQTGGRNDITPIFKDASAFKSLINDFEEALGEIEIDYIVGIDALGFILGAALAIQCEKGFIPIRKLGKLPVKAHSFSFVDYTGKTKGLELMENAFKPGDRIFLIDDWVETGAQIKAAIQLIEKQGAQIAAIGALSIDRNSKTDFIFEKYTAISLILNERYKPS